MTMNMCTLPDSCKTLIIGSLTLDIRLQIDSLPVRTQDVNVFQQQFAVGGCAYNVYQAMTTLDPSPCLLTRMGTGIYAQVLQQQIEDDKGIIIERCSEENGCCYCLVEKDGERSFLSVHGGEYHYPFAMIEAFDLSAIRCVYLCGIDLEETQNQRLLTILKNYPSIRLFFAPGPRAERLSASCWRTLYEMHPILHMNEAEVCALMGCDSPETAIQQAYARSKALVIVTMGERGSMAYDGKHLIYAPASPCKVVDTIGAGDAHAGACLAMLQQQIDVENMLKKANALAAQAVQCKGALQRK